MLRRIVYISLTLGLLGALAGAVGVWLVLRPNTPAFEGQRTVKIPPQASFESVVDSLEVRGILASRRIFRWTASLTGWREQIKAGHYGFESGASTYHLLDVLRKGLQTPVRVLIPPGSRPEVLAAVAAREIAFPPDSLTAALRDSALAAELETDVRHLFGYMLPDTYHFYWLTGARNVVRHVKQQFDGFFTDGMRQRADSLGLTVEEVITLASIVEWETGSDTEKPRIAGVYLNRLERGMPLQADPTVQFAVMQTEQKKRRLLFADYDVDHPYNTYKYRGLPPGPVTNPSASSIRAVVEPEEHDYLYFVANVDGGHTFSTSFREHVRAANEFRRAMRERRRQQRAEADSVQVR